MDCHQLNEWNFLALALNPTLAPASKHLRQEMGDMKI